MTVRQARYGIFLRRPGPPIIPNADHPIHEELVGNHSLTTFKRSNDGSIIPMESTSPIIKRVVVPDNNTVIITVGDKTNILRRDEINRDRVIMDWDHFGRRLHGLMWEPNIPTDGMQKR